MKPLEVEIPNSVLSNVSGPPIFWSSRHQRSGALRKPFIEYCVVQQYSDPQTINDHVRCEEVQISVGTARSQLRSGSAHVREIVRIDGRKDARIYVIYNVK